MEKQYFCYHKHTNSSNVMTIDSVATNEDFAIKTKELGHEWLSSCEHGGMPNWVDAYMCAKKHKLHYVHIGEFYFVKDRKETMIVEKNIFRTTDVVSVSQQRDKRNYHIVLVAKTKKAMEELNYIMSEANISGVYYKPRIDLELMRMLPKGEVIATTACIGGFLRDYPSEESQYMLDELIDIFGDNLFLEIQAHDTAKQQIYNKKILEIAKEYNIKMIAGTDSHCAFERQESERDYLVKSKGIIYDDEDDNGWYSDFPSRTELEERFRKQEIFTEDEIQEAIDNTLILTKTEPIVIDTRMKVPTIFQGKSRDWKLAHLKGILFNNWEKYKKHIPQERYKEYIDELLIEYGVIEETKMEDYFLTNYYMIKKGIEYGGVLTKTGRGSATSYLTNLILGFTTIDRLNTKVPILRERFMGKARIIDNNSSPDIDFNVAHREYFEQAQDELLGECCNYPMVAYGTLGIKSGFKMFCRAKDIPVSIADELSKHITSYLFDKKHDDNVSIKDYIKNEYHRELIKESEAYTGVIDSMSVHPCSYILANEDIRRTFGLLRTPNGVMVANVTGTQAEKLGYLKNDLLIVAVVEMNDKLYKNIGIEQPPSTVLYDWVLGDNGVWDLYSNGYTTCLNQMESTGTTQKVMRYKPLTTEELCNLVAMIRPACRSIYGIFEKRERFEYGIPDLDKLLQGQFLSASLITYQEQIMLLLEWLGFEESEGYSIMKAISKKKIDVIQSVKEKFESKLMEIMIKMKLMEMKQDDK